MPTNIPINFFSYLLCMLCVERHKNNVFEIYTLKIHVHCSCGTDSEKTKRHCKISGICRSSKFTDKLALAPAYYGSSFAPMEEFAVQTFVLKHFAQLPYFPKLSC